MSTFWIDVGGLLPAFAVSQTEPHPLLASEEWAWLKFLLARFPCQPAVVRLKLANQFPPDLGQQERLMAAAGRPGELPLVFEDCLPLHGTWLTLRADWSCGLLVSAPLDLQRLLLVAPWHEWLFGESNVDLGIRHKQAFCLADKWLATDRRTLLETVRLIEPWFSGSEVFPPQVVALSLLTDAAQGFPVFPGTSEKELLAFRDPEQVFLRMKSNMLWQTLLSPPTLPPPSI